ncbi:MAG: phosphoesterase [Chloroflexi bacterium]|nr:phosphoesterase [Chloroflexota bacterium]
MNEPRPGELLKNVFVLMLENHSFDNIFAMSRIPGIQAATLEDSNFAFGNKYAVEDGAPWSMTTDPGHEFEDVLAQLCGCDAVHSYQGGPYPPVNNSGFASNYATSTSESTGLPAAARVGDIMACFDTRRQLPVILELAKEFAICDRWFASVPGPTWPNRFFVHGASSAGWADSPQTKDEIPWETFEGFRYTNGSIFELLHASGHRWRLYNDNHNRYSDDPSGPEFGGWISQVASLKGISQLDIRSMDDFASDLQAMTPDGLPAYTEVYTFIEPNFGKSFFARQPAHTGVAHEHLAGPTYRGGSSQHPEDDPSGGEGLIKAVYEAVRSSPVWSTSLLFIVYDEHGGFYDSVKPGPATPPGDPPPRGQTARNARQFDFSQYGVRVPAVVVSPLIPRGTVDHTVYDHSSIPATLERLLHLKPLTKRDEAANDVLHLLTNSAPRNDCPRTLSPPVRWNGGTPRQAQAAELGVLGRTLGEQASEVETAIERVGEDLAAVIDEPLPTSGNVIGFLHVLLKTELECGTLDSNTEQAQARIVDNYKRVKTSGDAQAYVKAIAEKLENAQKARRPD